MTRFRAPGRLLYRTIPAAAAILAARPGSTAAEPGLALHLAPALVEPPPAPQENQPKPEEAPGAAQPFGEQGTWHWYIQGGLGLDFASDEFYLLGGGVSYFVANDISFNFELNGLAVQQLDDDALGLNLAFLVRFHFFKRPRWTVYADLGAGILGTTADVPGPTPEKPEGGTKFNFTPQLGLGFTYQLEPDLQLMVGARWYHISNANLWPNNPGRDSLFLYCGVSVPF